MEITDNYRTVISHQSEKDDVVDVRNLIRMTF
jgi:hypothetical protein